MSAPQIDLTFQACAKHGIPIERGAVCAECVREDPAPASNPPPLRGIGGSIHDLVIEDMSARKALGLGRYGTILQAGNGRDALLDAYEEALDLSAYLRQEIEERRLAGNLGGDTGPTEWPDLAPEVRFVVKVYANAGPSDRPDVVAINGPIAWSNDYPDLMDRFHDAISDDVGDPPAGFYLIATNPGSYRGGFSQRIAYETEDQRAERLAKGGA